MTWISTSLALGIGGFLWWWLSRRPRSGINTTSNWFPLVLTIGVICRLAYLFLTPTFYAPGEQAHFNYIKFVTEHGEFPILTTKLGDSANEWEYFQPPLYYLVLTPFYLFTKTVGMNLLSQVWLLRSFSFLLWLLNLWFGIGLLHRLQIKDRLVRTFALTLFCLLPTYTFSSITINNDNLLVTMSTGLLYLLAGRQYDWKAALQIGLLLGLGLLTKTSAITFAPVVIGLVVLEAQRRIFWQDTYFFQRCY